MSVQSVEVQVLAAPTVEVVLASAPAVVEVSVAIPGPAGPSGITIVNHGAVGSTARPAGATVVYWVGTATPANAIASDFWKDS